MPMYVLYKHFEFWSLCAVEEFPVMPCIPLLLQIDKYEGTTMEHKRKMMCRKMIDTYIMPDLLANDSVRYTYTHMYIPA